MLTARSEEKGRKALADVRLWPRLLWKPPKECSKDRRPRGYGVCYRFLCFQLDLLTDSSERFKVMTVWYQRVDCEVQVLMLS